VIISPDHQNRNVEDVLKTLVDLYPPETTIKPVPATPSPERSEVWRRVRDKAYAKARAYWLSQGDTVKAIMTEAELDEQFGAFDEEGIPRSKAELKTSEPPVGSLAYASRIIREKGGIRTASSLDVTRSDDILNEEFADYLS
jgi:hypothetical protein